VFLYFIDTLNEIHAEIKIFNLKRPRIEADHSPPSSVEVKNVWSYTSTPQYAYMVVMKQMEF